MLPIGHSAIPLLRQIGHAQTFFFKPYCFPSQGEVPSNQANRGGKIKAPGERRTRGPADGRNFLQEPLGKVRGSSLRAPGSSAEREGSQEKPESRPDSPNAAVQVRLTLGLPPHCRLRPGRLFLKPNASAFFWLLFSKRIAESPTSFTYRVKNIQWLQQTKKHQGRGLKSVFPSSPCFLHLLSKVERLEVSHHLKHAKSTACRHSVLLSVNISKWNSGL